MFNQEQAVKQKGSNMIENDDRKEENSTSAPILPTSQDCSREQMTENRTPIHKKYGNSKGRKMILPYQTAQPPSAENDSPL